MAVVPVCEAEATQEHKPTSVLRDSRQPIEAN